MRRRSQTPKVRHSREASGDLILIQRKSKPRPVRPERYGRRVTLIPWPERWFARVAGISLPLPFSADLPFERVRDQIKNLNRHSPRACDILESDELSFLRKGERVCSYCRFPLSASGWCRRCKLRRA